MAVPLAFVPFNPRAFVLLSTMILYYWIFKTSFLILFDILDNFQLNGISSTVMLLL